MEFILQLYSDEKRWEKQSDEEARQTNGAYMAYSKALVDSGAFVHANRLEPTSTATTVRVTSDGKTEVLDGPYVDTKEQLGGYYLIQAPDLDAAISWAARCPGASHGTIEVRPIAQVRAAV
jgi:hypothetical protein